MLKRGHEVTDQADDRDDMPMVTCDECGEECYEIELVDGVCLDCALIQRRKTRKTKGYANDIHTSDKKTE